MFGLSGTELLVIAVLALLVLGPKKLPELARTLGKGIREFRKATDGVRDTVEREFYKMDREVSTDRSPYDSADKAPKVLPGEVSPPAIGVGPGATSPGALTADQLPTSDQVPKKGPDEAPQGPQPEVRKA